MRSTVCALAMTLFAASEVGAVTFPVLEWGQVSLEERQLQAPSAYPNTGAVVIFDKGFAVTELKGVSFNRHTRIKIIDTSGITKITPVVIECRAYDWIRDVAALIHRPDGQVVEIEEKQTRKFEDKTNRSVTLTFPGLAAGDILEYTYTIHYYGGVDRLGAEKYFLFSQAISYEWLKERKKKTVEWDESLYKRVSNLPSWHFDNPVYTFYSELTVKLGSELDYTCVPSNLPVESQHPEVRRGSGIIDRVYKYHTWKMEDVPPTEIEPLMPHPNDYRPSLHFELFSTDGENRIIIGNYADVHWLNVGKNIQGYLSMYIKRPRQLTIDALAAVSDLTTDHEKIQHLYELARGRYRADEGGYRLRPVGKNLRKFFEKRSGAPFELNILLVEMLKAAGIDAWPVLISKRDQVDFRRTARFNHMIAYAKIDDIGIFMDASSKACPFGSLPPLCLVSEGLLVDFDQSRLVSILTADPGSYRIDSITLRSKSNGSAAASVMSTLNGYPAMELGDYLEHAVKGQRDSLWSSAVSDITAWNDLRWRYDSLGRCIVEAQITLDGPSRRGFTRGVFSTMPLLAANPFATPVRLQPIDFLYPFRYESRLAVPLSELSVKVDSIPSDSFDIEGASFSRSVRKTDSAFTVITRLEISKPMFTAAEYTALRAFLERASPLSLQPF